MKLEIDLAAVVFWAGLWAAVIVYLVTRAGCG